MARLSTSFLRETIAYVPQEIRLISGTLRDNLLQVCPTRETMPCGGGPPDCSSV